MAIDNQIENMLTVREVASILHVHPNTLRRWADKGILESIRITTRGDRRFTPQDIDQFLSKMKTQNSGNNREK